MTRDFGYYLQESGEVGYVEEAVTSAARLRGLPGARLGEMVMMETGETGQVLALDEGLVEALVFGTGKIRIGTRVVRVGQTVTVPVGEGLLGLTVDGLGRRISGVLKGQLAAAYAVDVSPAGIGVRRRVGRPMDTGVALIDLLVPLGRGQRELFIGDRKTGKSVITLTTMMTQARLGMVCVYAAIGKQKADVKRVEQFVEAGGISATTVIVASSAKDSLGEIFLTPYTAMAVAEYFRDIGREVMIVLDDMTTHAKFYREMSLVLKRFPGRDAYPGDIFHVHSKLLERAGNFVVGDREVAITAVPIAETVQGDLTGYIPTNLMSMTDGHVYFDADLFFRGRRPAIDPYVSVTRVGHQTQTQLQREITQEVLNLLSQYERTQSFLRFGAELGESSRQILALGDKLLTFFDQPLLSVVPRGLGVVLVGLLLAGAWNGKEMEGILAWYGGNEAVRGEIATLVSQGTSLSAFMTGVRQKAELFSKVISR